jgi:hypothetical protein
MALPRPRSGDVRANRVVEIAGVLAAKDARFGEWAAEVGVTVGSVQDGRRPALIAELDALSASLYGLSRNQLVHIFETFHRGWNFMQRLQDTLTFFDHWVEL